MILTFTKDEMESIEIALVHRCVEMELRIKDSDDDYFKTELAIAERILKSIRGEATE